MKALIFYIFFIPFLFLVSRAFPIGAIFMFVTWFFLQFLITVEKKPALNFFLDKI